LLTYHDDTAVQEIIDAKMDFVIAAAHRLRSTN
jgi:hypothetical protein